LSLPLLLCEEEERKEATTTGKMPVRLMGGTPMLRQGDARPGRIMAALQRLACDQRGASTVEYLLLIALVGLPSMVVFRMLLSYMSEYYRMVVFFETLPMP
jgi:hypothetical protein